MWKSWRPWERIFYSTLAVVTVVGALYVVKWFLARCEMANQAVRAEQSSYAQENLAELPPVMAEMPEPVVPKPIAPYPCPLTGPVEVFATHTASVLSDVEVVAPVERDKYGISWHVRGLVQNESSFLNVEDCEFHFVVKLWNKRLNKEEERDHLVRVVKSEEKKPLLPMANHPFDASFRSQCDSDDWVTERTAHLDNERAFDPR